MEHVSGAVSAPARVSLFAVGTGRGRGAQPSAPGAAPVLPQRQLRAGQWAPDWGRCRWDARGVREAPDRPLCASPRPPPPPVLSPGFAGVVLLELTARGPAQLRTRGIRGRTAVVGTRVGWAFVSRWVVTPPGATGAAVAGGEGSGWRPARGARRPGPREGRGGEGGAGFPSPLPPGLCSVARLAVPAPPIVQSWHPGTRGRSCAPGIPPEREPSPPASGGAGARDTAAPGTFSWWGSGRGADPDWPADVPAPLPAPHPPVGRPDRAGDRTAPARLAPARGVLGGRLSLEGFPARPPGAPFRLPEDPPDWVLSSLQMKELGAERLAGREGVQLFGLLTLYLEQEPRFQPRERGLSLIEATSEVRRRELAAAADGVAFLLLLSGAEAEGGQVSSDQRRAPWRTKIHLPRRVGGSLGIQHFPCGNALCL